MFSAFLARPFLFFPSPLRMIYGVDKRTNWHEIEGRVSKELFFWKKIISENQEEEIIIILGSDEMRLSIAGASPITLPFSRVNANSFSDKNIPAITGEGVGMEAIISIFPSLEMLA